MYLDATGSHFLLASEGIGSLEERGAEWLFVRYLVDRFATDTSQAAQNAFTRSLVRTPLIGATNVQTRTGRPFGETLARWALANWVSDLPGFTPSPELTYRSWAFRTTFGSIYQQCQTNPQPGCGTFQKPYPLVPTVSPGDGVSLSGTLRAGSGAYHRILQAPGSAAFTLLLSNGSGRAVSNSVAPRVNIIRIR